MDESPIPSTAFPMQIVAVMHAMAAEPHASMQILGSAAKPTIVPWSDVDLFQIAHVNSAADAASKLQHVVHTLLRLPSTYVLDIKAGHDNKGEDEHWTTQEISKGEHDTTNLALTDAVAMPARVKVDAATWVPGLGRYVEVACVFQFILHGKTPLNRINKPGQSVQRGLKDDVKTFLKEGRYDKAAKRMFSLARMLKRPQDESKLAGLLNSPAASLSVLVSDIALLESMLEHPEIGTEEEMRQEVDALKLRVAKMYGVPNLRATWPSLFHILDAAASAPNARAMLALLQEGEQELSPVLQGAFEGQMRHLKLLPPNKAYL